MKTGSLRVASALIVGTLLGVACSGSSSSGSSPSADQPAKSGTEDARVPSAVRALGVKGLRTEYRVDPLGIDVARPRLDWILESSVRGQRQTAYRILVASTREQLARDQGDLWDTGKIASDQTSQLEYGGTPVPSRQRAFWKVRAWDKDDVPSGWSEIASWERGLSSSDWQAKWIASPVANASLAGTQWIWFAEGDPVVTAPAGERYFRKSFTIPEGAHVAGATCAITVDDEFELFVNGTSLGFERRWEDVKRFSVGHLLTTGSNVIAVRGVNTSQSPAGLVASVEIAFETGPGLKITSDSSWKAISSRAPDWQTTTYDDAAWPAAKTLAAFGGGPWGTPLAGSAPAYLRKPFTATKVKRARIHATALGLYELWLNGQRVGSEYLTPGFTDYRKRLQVQTYDVTALLSEGENAVGAIVADGWFNGKVGFLGRGDYFGTGPNRLLFQLEIEQQDGTRKVVASDGTGPNAWKYSEGPIFAADLMDGETYDARKEQSGWSSAGFDDTRWAEAQVVADDSNRLLVADATAGVQRTEERTPISINEIRPGVFIYDLGQNMVGWARIRVQGARGSTLKLRFGEVLNPDGTLYTENLRGARATDVYTLRGGAEETFEPRFTTHGFRFVELSGDIDRLSKKPDSSALTGVVVHSFMKPSGTFETSSPVINQLQSNIVWGQRGNFVSVPTDCPQRDERLGWLGDAQVFVKTSTFNMDVASFFTKWMRDVHDAQADNGAFPDVAPNPGWNVGTPAWGDAGVIVPWTMYLAYGDTRILSEHYSAMAAWVEYIGQANPNFLWQNQRSSDYGDWLSINADSDKEVIATAFYAHSADLVARAARVLGKSADADRFAARFGSIKSAFNTAYVTADGRIRGNTQAVYALALRFDLLPEGLRASAANHLAGDIQSRGHLSTGFIGVSHLLPVLTAHGRVDLAYQLLNTDTFPSWLYSIKKGATTIWERWDGIRPNGEFQDKGMNSFNHYSFGAVGEWMYGTVAGIELDEAKPGYKHFFVRPRPGGGIDSAVGKLDTIHGRIVSDWRIANGVFTLALTVPVNTTANVILPFQSDVREGGARMTAEAAADGSYAVGSGDFVFTARAP